MVIANGISQEILNLILILELYDLLCTTKIGLCLITNQRAFCNEVMFHVTRNLKDSNRSLFHITTNAHTNTRFKMRIQFVAFYHIKRDSTMGEQHFACFRIDVRVVGLETRNAKK